MDQQQDHNTPIDETRNEPEDELEQRLALRPLPRDLRIHLSETALHQAERMAHEEEAYKRLSLRLYIEGKGCDGFYYGVSFDAKTEHDVAWTQGEVELVCDPESLRFMHGSTVEWVDDERGRGFLVENPNHKKYRGKFFKRRSWQEKLAPTTSSSQ